MTVGPEAKLVVPLCSNGSSPLVGISERQKELKRRRHRTVKLNQLKARAEKASTAEKAVIAAKLRRLTTGAEDLIVRWGLEEN